MENDKPILLIETFGNDKCIIAAFKNGKKVGRYLLESLPRESPEGRKIFGSHVETTEHGKGIGRALIEKAIEVLPDLARSNKRDIEHWAISETPESANKLSHIFKEKGYEITNSPFGLAHIKVYPFVKE